MMPFYFFLVTVQYHHEKSPKPSIPLRNTVLESPTMSKSRFLESGWSRCVSHLWLGRCSLLFFSLYSFGTQERTNGTSGLLTPDKRGWDKQRLSSLFEWWRHENWWSICPQKVCCISGILIYQYQTSPRILLFISLHFPFRWLQPQVANLFEAWDDRCEWNLQSRKRRKIDVFSWGGSRGDFPHLPCGFQGKWGLSVWDMQHDYILWICTNIFIYIYIHIYFCIYTYIDRTGTCATLKSQFVTHRRLSSLGK